MGGFFRIRWPSFERQTAPARDFRVEAQRMRSQRYTRVQNLAVRQLFERGYGSRSGPAFAIPGHSFSTARQD